MLKEVLILSSVYTDCFTHALTTDREEVMGVLLGEVLLADSAPQPHQQQQHDDFLRNNNSNSNPMFATAPPIGLHSTNRQSVVKVARVWASRAIQRNDKRKDRVEIAPEHLAQATDEAEACSRALGRHTRVIGWYHSHPCITPYPSHVDLRCQQGFQQMESGWVGLIFSVFHSDSSLTGSAVLHSFQTTESGGHAKVPVRILSSTDMFPKGFPLFEQVPRLLHTYEAEMHVLQEREKNRCGSSEHMCRAVDSAVELESIEFNNVVGHSVIRQLAMGSVPELRQRVESLRAELDALQS